MKKPFILVSVAAALILLLGTAARLLGYVNTPPQPREPQRFDAVSELSDFEAGLRKYVSDCQFRCAFFMRSQLHLHASHGMICVNPF